MRAKKWPDQQAGERTHAAADPIPNGIGETGPMRYPPGMRHGGQLPSAQAPTGAFDAQQHAAQPDVAAAGTRPPESSG